VSEDIEIRASMHAGDAALLQAVAAETGDTIGHIIGWLVQHNKIELKRMAPKYSKGGK
jgi:hypothetical protein